MKWLVQSQNAAALGRFSISHGPGVWLLGRVHKFLPVLLSVHLNGSKSISIAGEEDFGSGGSDYRISWYGVDASTLQAGTVSGRWRKHHLREVPGFIESDTDDNSSRGKERGDKRDELPSGEPRFEGFEIRKQGLVDGATLPDRDRLRSHKA